MAIDRDNRNKVVNNSTLGKLANAVGPGMCMANSSNTIEAFGGTFSGSVAVGVGGTVVVIVLLLLAGYIAFKWWERRRFYALLDMARINVDGTLDQDFNPSAFGGIGCIVVPTELTRNSNFAGADRVLGSIGELLTVL